MTLQTFDYPGIGGPGGRAIREGGTSYHLCKSQTLNSKVLVIEPGTHNEAHAHADEDAHYFVLRGRVRFYDGGDHIAAELGTHDGLLMPHDMEYWFESCGTEPLEMLRVSTRLRDGTA
jgi:mannose-6-phosphate isomerase-like protein (cupin superfamily)